MKTVGDLFRAVPLQWGLRGDAYLWRDLARVFRPVPLPASRNTLQAMVEAAFLVLTAHPITTRDAIFVARYAHGGMSSGYLSPDFWTQTGIPLIIQRFSDYQERSSIPVQKDIWSDTDDTRNNVLGR